METSLVRDVQILSTGVLGSFAILHLILYLQQRSARSNLVFGLALLFAALATFLDFQTNFVEPGHEITLLRFQRVASMMWGVLLYLLVLVFFDRKVVTERRLVVGLAVLIGVLVAAEPIRLLPLGHAGSAVLMVLIVRHTVIAIRRRLPNATTIAIGLGFLFLSMFYDLTLDMLFPDTDLLISNGYPFGIMAFLVATSWALGRDTARVHQRLAEEATARAFSESELRHRQADIRDARRLQQSFLPECPPSNRTMDVCFKQKMAMEVGGDYYDYHELEGDALLLAVGDATGHGTRGGLMVAAVKSLFQTADVTAPPDVIIRQASHAIKQMNLQSMFMGLTVVRVGNGSAHLAAAGMPPALVRRATTGLVDRIVQKTMPLGAFRDFPYERTEITLAPGDMIVLLSDGLVECFNPARDQFGLDRIAEILARSDTLTSTETADAILEGADAWRRNVPFEDDVTLAVVRMLDKADS